MQLNRYPAEPVAGEPPSLCSLWARQDSFDTGFRGGVATWKNVDNNIYVQTGEEFPVGFLQEYTPPAVITPVYGVSVTPVYQHSIGVSDVQDGQCVHEELPRALGFRRMDSECRIDITESALSEGSSGAHADNGVYMSKGSMNYQDIEANGHKPNTSAAKVCSHQACLVSNAPLLRESDSSRSLNSLMPGVSNSCRSEKVKLLCSFGGKILPRQGDGKLKYMGGETHIISIPKNISWEELLKKTAGMCNQPHLIKYQLPGEDLDALISVSCDEDLKNMIDEYSAAEKLDGSQRLRIFLIPLSECEGLYAHDASYLLQKNVDCKYAFGASGVDGTLVNGVGSSDSAPLNFYSGLPYENEMGHLVPSGEPNVRYANNVPLPMDPVEMKDRDPPGVPVLIETFDGSQKLIRSPSLPPEVMRREDMKNAKMAAHRNNSSLGSISPRVSLPPEDSICYTAHHHLTPQLAVNLRNSHDQIGKHDAILPNNRIPILKGENVAPHQLEQHYGIFELCSQERDAKMERTLDIENPLPQPDNLGGTLFVSSDSFGYNHGMPHVCSDSSIQDQGNSLAYSSPEGIPQSILLNLGRPQPSSCGPAAAFEKKPVELHEKVSFINTQLQTEALNAEPNIPVTGMTLQKSPSASDALTKLEVIHQDVNGAVEKQLSKEDLRNQSFEVKAHEKECVSNSEVNFSNPPFGSGEFYFCDRSPAVSKSITSALQNGNFEPSSLYMKSSKQDSQVSCGLNPELSSASAKHLNHSGLEQAEVAELLHEASKGVANNFFEELRLDEPIGVVNERRTNTPRNSVSYKRENSLPNNKLSGTSNVDKPDSFGVSKYSDLLDDLPIDLTLQCQQKPVKNHNISSTQPPSEAVSDTPHPAKTQVLSPPSPDAKCVLQNLDFEDVRTNNGEDKLFSEALIAEMEADLYGLQIIRSADLEEVRELGSGTYGTVYYGKWRGTDVAIKRINKACFSGKPSEQERLTKDFWREACILSNLHHPNVVAFYGVVPDGGGGTLATVTEFMANGSLRTALIRKDKSLDYGKKLIIAMDAAFGMEYLHSKNIVHFDLKCDNLLVNLIDPQRPVCKVGDFGLSKIKRNTLVSGGVRGTLPWMAPELLNGSATRVSEKVDVYSFGIVLWELLTGQEPYANMHCGAIIGGIVKNTLRPPIPEWCDPKWRKLMEQCWSADPEARPSFTEIAKKLRSMSSALEAKRQTDLLVHTTN
ncbi:uncharacterized protein LOC127244179 [Andrographis paniculata]|uniref:uncharacterized protein LOC127244179 n=1 Tax=Andrographis paniculata TaxID=175694 RepID=UPI0021E79C5D|nr:uncharacterized protein LOC127244179 [Andrographis paniculata]